MIERLRGKVEKVKFIEKAGDDLDLCELQIDFDTVKIFGDSSDFMKFIGQEVLYTKRPDIIHGVPEMVVYDLVLMSTIQTLDKRENIKLVPQGTQRTICNLASRDVVFGEYYTNVVAFMSEVELGSSAKSKWFDCKMIDMQSKEFQVRLFATNVDRDQMFELLKSFVGGYVTFDFESTKYGFQTKEIVALPNEVELAPEVVVAKQVLMDAICEDDALRAYELKYNFLNTISAVIDGEPGYHLVRMASEIYMINAIDDISCELDIRAMKRAAICSRGYLLPKKTNWSRITLNTNRVLQVPELKADMELRMILDTLCEEESTETKRMYIKIRGLVNDIIDIRRGIVDEKEIENITLMRSALNGLC